MSTTDDVKALRAAVNALPSLLDSLLTRAADAMERLDVWRTTGAHGQNCSVEVNGGLPCGMLYPCVRHPPPRAFQQEADDLRHERDNALARVAELEAAADMAWGVYGSSEYKGKSWGENDAEVMGLLEDALDGGAAALDAALAKARREGAEAMRAAAVDECLRTANEIEDNCLREGAERISALPLPGDPP